MLYFSFTPWWPFLTGDEDGASNKAPIKKATLNSSNPLAWWVPSSLLPLRRCAFTFVFHLLLFFYLRKPPHGYYELHLAFSPSHV